LIKIIAGGLCASGEYMNHPDSIYCTKNPNSQRMKGIFTEMRSPEATSEERNELAKEWIMMSLYRKDAYDDMLKRKHSGRNLMFKIDYYTEELTEYDVRDELKQSGVRAYIYCGRHGAQCPDVLIKEAADLM